MAMGSSNNSLKLEVNTEDDMKNAQKWCVALSEQVFKRLMSEANPLMQKVFGDGCLFSPMLFGKYFDPSDAFPLWEFESDVLFSNLTNSSLHWFHTDQAYLLKAELPGINGKNNKSVEVYVEKGKVMEISGKWKDQTDAKKKEWKSSHWWEYGYVRRLELPEDADSKRIEAFLNNDLILEIRIPKRKSKCDTTKGFGTDIDHATQSKKSDSM